MKRVVLVIAALAFVVLAGTSCKKCTTCRATGHATLGNVTTDEFCGTTEEVDAYQDDQELTYTVMGYTSVICD